MLEIVICGHDGTGKSTQVKLLENYLKTNNYSVKRIDQPTKTDLGKTIRKYLNEHDITSGKMPYALACMFAANRYEIETELEKVRKEVDFIIHDRNGISNLVYSKLIDLPSDFHWFEVMESMIKIPDIILILDQDPEVSFRRTEKLGQYEDLEFLRGARERYLKVAKIYNEKTTVKVIDCNGKTKKEVHLEIISRLNDFIRGGD